LRPKIHRFISSPFPWEGGQGDGEESGITYHSATTQNDFFAIPDRGFDDTVFVISDMTVMVEKLGGQLAVHFHGAVEWALDTIWRYCTLWKTRAGNL
jgi:hypothetical protein